MLFFKHLDDIFIHSMYARHKISSSTLHHLQPIRVAFSGGGGKSDSDAVHYEAQSIIYTIIIIEPFKLLSVCLNIVSSTAI